MNDWKYAATIADLDCITLRSSYSKFRDYRGRWVHVNTPSDRVLGQLVFSRLFHSTLGPPPANYPHKPSRSAEHKRHVECYQIWLDSRNL